MSCSFLDGFLMNEEQTESRALMYWFYLLFKNVINVNKEFFKSCQSSHDHHNLLLESNIHIPDPTFCNREEQKFHLFIFIFFIFSRVLRHLAEARTSVPPFK